MKQDLNHLSPTPDFVVNIFLISFQVIRTLWESEIHQTFVRVVVVDHPKSRFHEVPIKTHMSKKSHKYVQLTSLNYDLRWRMTCPQQPLARSCQPRLQHWCGEGPRPVERGGWLIDWLVFWFIELLIDWLIDVVRVLVQLSEVAAFELSILIDWLIHSFFWFIYWLIDI